MAKNAQPPEGGATPASFEQAMQELERVVAEMESGELSLEAALAAHKRGLELARHCQDVLARAQQQVTMLEERFARNPEQDEPGA